MRYLGNNVWDHGIWKVIGHDVSGFDLWVWVWDGDPNTSMRHVRHFDTMCDCEQWLRMEAKVQLDG